MAKITRFLKKLKPYTIKKGFRYLKHYGFKEFMHRLGERMEPEEIPYGAWYEKHKATEETLKKQAKTVWENQPLFSIAVPAYKTPEKFLRQMIESLRAQSYPHWELCIENASPEDAVMEQVLLEYQAKDSRVRWEKLAWNKGIAENTNACFAMARGDYIGLLDHDDMLAPDALYEVAVRIRDEQADMIYTDEDKVDAGLTEHYQPHFKPDYSPDLLCSNNYICHFTVVKRELVDKVGGFRPAFDGAQDHDFIFRCSEQARQISHVPRILYHWRTHSTSTADNPASKLYAYEAGKKAIEEHLQRTNTAGEVSMTKDFGFFRVKYPVQESPMVSVIIPNKDQKDTLKSCIDSVLTKTTYDNYEILIVENNSTDPETFAYYEELKKNDKIRILTWKKGFNFSAINNFAATFAKGEYLLFLNNDITVITPEWMEELLGNCQRKEVGIVGCKLLYPDRTIQHAGVIIGIGGIAGHAFLGMPSTRTGYMHKASIQLNYSAVTAACLMMKKSVFEEIGGYEEKLQVAFNDVDLCLRTVKADYLVVYDPYAQMFHHESKSRGSEDTEEKVQRFHSEIEFMRIRWGKLLKAGDPYYNQNLTLSKWNYSLRAN